MLSSKFKIKKERYLHTDREGDKAYITQYTNGVYTIFFTEEMGEEYARVMKNEIDYPTIFDDGINIGSTGTLSSEEVEEHIKKIIFAKETFEQIKKLGENLKIC